MNNKENLPAEGRLPSLAPLANPYVPYQMNNPPRYEPRLALVRGTLFSGLDLPFMGMVNKKEKPITPMTELQTVAFAIQELALYLDTHQEDEEAFMLYQRFQNLYQEMVQVYEKDCGPVTHMNMTDKQSYQWLKSPWPWEYNEKQEV